MSMKILIVVDMLNDFIDERGSLYCGQDARDIIPFIKGCINTYRADRNLVIYLQDSHEEDDKEFERFPKHAVIGTWGNEIISELKPTKDDKVIQKTRYSGFYNTTLKTLLYSLKEWHGIEDIKVVGVCTSICVMDTVGGLANRDYNVIVPRAGVADFDQDNHENALTRMANLYGAKIVE